MTEDHAHGPGLTDRPSATGKARISALDGLRAFALLIIMGYHFGVGWLQGGFFSLDIFYVLSGYLITGLLLSEYARKGRIVLSAFWLRRARRLLPALLIVLVAVTVMVRFAEPAGLYPDFRMSALSALFYFSNWWQIAASSNYFVATGAVSPLTHTWSLAVEEQFYLVWPLVTLAVLHLSRTIARGVRALLVVSVAGAIASALEMALSYSPTANTTRLYFGTDTHAQSILIGATLACVLTMVQQHRGNQGMAPVATTKAARWALVALGLAGLAGTLTLTYSLQGLDPFDYQGGFTLSALSAAAIIIGAVCVPTGPLARVLSLRVLVWIGTVSYGAYLWHYPVFVYLDYDRTGLTGIGLLAVRFAVTFALAAASFYLVERPVMEGRFWRSVKAIAPATALMGATVAVVLVGTVGVAQASVRVDRYVPTPTAGRTAGHPPHIVLVLGDSTAGTLEAALAATAPAGTRVVTGALFGCGLAVSRYSSSDPPTPQLAIAPPCNEATPISQQWPALDSIRVAATAPGRGDVVLFVAGTWETQDLLVDGQWTNLLRPSFQRYVAAQMQKAVTVGTATGAHLDFTTMAAVAASEHDPDGSARRRIYNRLVERVAAEHPGTVSVIDYGRILTPRGVFTEDLDGVQIRTPDGIHTPAYQPGNEFVSNASAATADAFYNWLSPRIWPLIIASSGPSATPGPTG